jgi:pimeloyl-ACP methyl ester carboxylesterase
MATNLDDAVVVFVPGILGSILRFRGTGTLGEPIDEVVWGEDLVQNADILAAHPERLASSRLQPDGVIEWVKSGWLPKKPVYGPLLEFCKRDAGLGLVEGQNFFPFGYDWRADNRETAQTLGELINRADPSGQREVFFIAHSMGGLVCRLLLLTDASIARRVRLFFQIASPTRGSAKAFDSLRRRPQFDKLFDCVWTLAHNWQPDRRARLVQTLTGFPSLFQLLPPKDVYTLVTEDGAEHAALVREAWHANLQPMLDRAEQVHALLARPIRSPMKCVYAGGHETPLKYVVSRDWNIKAEWNPVQGDGTVTCASAYAQSRPEQRCLISGRTDHTTLCGDDQVFELLRKEILG